ncbi:cell wall-binding repeat-containing protein [Clostridium tetani]|uniref:cell wall-binding repeat-containing protein n=1 Tax=Clostridium tetani TaxID=1513 RepID=UPI00068DB5A8|nr:cell wall-binding repeat-containing protein [Clostridium tetani]RXM74648.1 cell wall-binding repeat-containing protein [Clostridium tetani]SUY67077.1 cell wall-binding protein [Clostridium tetani]
MKKLNKALSSTALATIIATTNLTMVQAKVDNRLGGKNRYETARFIAEKYSKGSVDKVILASGKGPFDALVSSLLSKKLNAPILLVGGSADQYKDAFNYMDKHLSKSGTVYFLGGEASVNKDVEAHVKKSGFKFKRLSGKDRFETNNSVLNEINVSKGTPVFLVNGYGFADSLSVSSISAIKDYPVIMTTKDTIPSNLKAQLTKLQPSKVYIIGSENIVSQKVQEELYKINKNLKMDDVVRIYGKDRFETNILINKAFNVKSNNAFVASGMDFADALSGSALAGKYNAPIVLTNNKNFQNEKDYLASTDYKNFFILGLEGSVNKSIESTLNSVKEPSKAAGEFMDKLSKAEEIKSYATQSDVTIKFTSKNLPSDIQTGFNAFTKEIGDTITLKTTGKLEADSKDKAKQEFTATLKLGGTMKDKDLSFPMWAEVDTSNKVKPDMKVTYGIPKDLLKNVEDASFDQLKNKDYITLDLSNMSLPGEDGKTGFKMDSSKLVSFLKDNEKLMEKISLRFAAEFNPNLDVVKNEGAVTLKDGRKATCYSIALNNESLSTLLRYGGNNVLNLLQDKEVVTFLKSYMNIYMESMNFEGLNKDEMLEIKKEMEASIDNLLNNGPKSSLTMHQIIDGFKSLNLLGNDGIKMKFYLNNKNIPISSEGSIDINVNFKNFIPTAKGEIEMKIDFKNSISNINDDSIKVSLPNTNKDNSLDYFQFLNNLLMPLEETK